MKTDRVALVTGGAKGIGAGIARRLANDKLKVVVADKDFTDAETIPQVRRVECDMASELAIKNLIADIAATEGRLDHLVCNAGVMIRKPIASLSLEEWNSVLATNLTSIFLLAREGEALLRKSGGSIVTVASTRAHMSEADTEAYSATKGGVVALTHALAVSLGPDIRVNCISPGWINNRHEALRKKDHAQHPAGRVGAVEDIAAMAAFLLYGESGFITGAEMVVDGGMTRKMIYVE